MADEDRKERFIDRLGPTLTSSLVVTGLAALTVGAVAVRDLVLASTNELAHLSADVGKLRDDIERFKAPGGRFTSHDGDRHWSRMDDLDKRLREQESRPPRLSPELREAMGELRDMEHDMTTAKTQIQHILTEQGRLCERVRACK